MTQYQKDACGAGLLAREVNQADGEPVFTDYKTNNTNNYTKIIEFVLYTTSCLLLCFSLIFISLTLSVVSRILEQGDMTMPYITQAAVIVFNYSPIRILINCFLVFIIMAVVYYLAGKYCSNFSSIALILFFQSATVFLITFFIAAVVCPFQPCGYLR